MVSTSTLRFLTVPPAKGGASPAPVHYSIMISPAMDHRMGRPADLESPPGGRRPTESPLPDPPGFFRAPAAARPTPRRHCTPLFDAAGTVRPPRATAHPRTNPSIH